MFALMAPICCAQIDLGKGWLEGVVVNEKGDPGWDWPDYRGAVVTLKPRHGKSQHVVIELNKGGYYTFRNIRPGIYELFVDRSFIKVDNKWEQFRPQHIFGVVIKRNQRTVLNLKLHQGKDLEEIGKPTVPTRGIK